MAINSSGAEIAPKMGCLRIILNSSSAPDAFVSGRSKELLKSAHHASYINAFS